MAIHLKRAYDSPGSSDGFRVLVDRLWPRGLTKAKAKIDLWMKDIAPSTELRQWFTHDPGKWPEFQKRYRRELAQHKDLVAELRKRSKARTVTLIYSAKDEQHNDAVVLKRYLER